MNRPTNDSVSKKITFQELQEQVNKSHKVFGKGSKSLEEICDAIQDDLHIPLSHFSPSLTQTKEEKSTQASLKEECLVLENNMNMLLELLFEQEQETQGSILEFMESAQSEVQHIFENGFVFEMIFKTDWYYLANAKHKKCIVTIFKRYKEMTLLQEKYMGNRNQYDTIRFTVSALLQKSLYRHFSKTSFQHLETMKEPFLTLDRLMLPPLCKR